MTLITSGIRNMWASLRHTLRERPDVVISTGAGSALFTALFGRMTGAKFVLIESFARVRAPSLFGRMVHRSEEHTSELQSLMRISYAVFCLKKQITYKK